VLLADGRMAVPALLSPVACRLSPVGTHPAPLLGVPHGQNGGWSVRRLPGHPRVCVRVLTLNETKGRATMANELLGRNSDQGPAVSRRLAADRRPLAARPVSGWMLSLFCGGGSLPR
jgi:hypothetical protein